MSNKRWRKKPQNPTWTNPADGKPAPPAESAPAGHDAPGASQTTPTTVDQSLSEQDRSLLDGVKNLLGKIIERVTQVIEQIPQDPPTGPQAEFWVKDDHKRITQAARIGISAARALMQAFRITGADTKAVKKLIDQATNGLIDRLERIDLQAT